MEDKVRGLIWIHIRSSLIPDRYRRRTGVESWGDLTIVGIGSDLPPAAAEFRCRSAFLNRCGAASCRSIFLRCRSAAEFFQVFEFLPQTAANFFKISWLCRRMPQILKKCRDFAGICRKMPQKNQFLLWSCRRLPQNHLSHNNTKYAMKLCHHAVFTYEWDVRKNAI